MRALRRIARTYVGAEPFSHLWPLRPRTAVDGGLSPIQGAAVSVMANIAEGFVRHSDKEFVQFLFVAMASAAEVQSHLYVAVDQEYLVPETFDSIYAQAGKTSRIISGLIKYLRRKTRQTK